jgi:hypothetical protein
MVGYCSLKFDVGLAIREAVRTSRRNRPYGGIYSSSEGPFLVPVEIPFVSGT